MRPFARWLLLMAIWLLPVLALLAAGAVHLWQQRWFLYWAVGTLVVYLAGWGVSAWWDRRLRRGPPADVAPAAHWPVAGERAWQNVVQLAERANSEQWPIATPEDWWRMLREALTVVAREFYPHSADPLLEVRVPHVLKVVELVAADLRRSVTNNVPGTHLVTVQQVVQLQRWWQRAHKAWGAVYSLYRVGRVLANPSGALLREAGEALAEGVWRQSVGDVRAWLVDYTIKKAGYYAILLYSGQLVLDERLARDLPPPSADEMQRVDEREEALAAEPLRVVVMGQVKAGKSSLVNALFGQTKAAVDVLPATARAAAYRYEQAGLAHALVIDTGGYGGDGGAQLIAELEEQIKRCDLLLVVLSALNAARAPDRCMLDRVRQLCSQQPRRAPPAVLAVVTHIDLLRPRGEWSPPYDLRSPPPGSKAANIAAAVEAVAEDLGLETDQVVPLSLRPGTQYNVDACVLAIAAAAPAAERARYLRAFEAYAGRERWELLGKQIKSGGRMLLGTAADAVQKLLPWLMVSEEAKASSPERTTALPAAGRSSTDPHPGVQEMIGQSPPAANNHIRLGEIALARSGDKGNHANIGVVAYTPAGYEYLRQVLTAERVAEYFAPLGASRVVRYELPRLCAFNFVLYDVLAGGASRSLRIDSQGKLLGTAMLELALPLPENIEQMRRPQAAG